MDGRQDAARWVGRVKGISTVVAAVALLLIARAAPVDLLLAELQRWIGHFGVWAPAVFVLIYIPWTVAMLPGSALTLASGALFGLGPGVAVALTGATLGAGAAFLIARHFARNAVQRRLRGSRRLAALDRAVGQGGWRIVALMRLSPAIPFNLQNYLYGVTPIGFWPCILASAVFMLPGALLYVYFGHLGAQGLAAAAGGGDRGAAQWALLAAGLAATIAVTLYVARLASKQLARQTALDTEAAAPAPAPSRRSAALTAGFALALAAAAITTLVKPGLFVSLFGPPQVALAEAYEPKAGGPAFDHSVLDRLLRTYVDDEGMVDYRRLAGRDEPALDAYLRSLATAPFADLGRDEKLALLINAYNAFTLRLILDRYPLGSIRDIPADQRWDAVRWEIGGVRYSLNQIEHEEIRPKFVEPRIHFALVCAAVGCPPLRREAYVGGRLDAQLEEQALHVHTHEKWFQFEPEGPAVKLTQLYQWYGNDFAQVAGSALAFAAQYSPGLAEALEQGARPAVHWLEYDWSLNEQR